MTRYQKLWESPKAERALNRYNTDKDKLDADSVNFEPIDDMDMGDSYLVSYDMPMIVPISEILWIRFVELWGMKHMWTLCSDGYTQLLLVNDPDNIDTIVKMLCARNKKLIYGENDALKELFEADFEEFRKLIALHPNENAADITVDPALLPVAEEEEPEEAADSTGITEETETPYIPPQKQDPDSVCVPESLPFAEEMELLLHLAKEYPDDVELTLYEPASASDIDEFESRNNIKLTDELKSLFRFSNGFDLSVGNISINTLDLTERHLSTEWEWGDTKNYVYIGDMIGDGELILLDTDTGSIITDDHGEETDYGDLTALLSDTICNFLDGEIEDEDLEAYISAIEDMNE